MSNSDEIRWMQRLENFGNALSNLTEACDIAPNTETVTNGSCHPALLRLHVSSRATAEP